MNAPAFSSHLFAISGVSGGSIGASVYASLLQQVDLNFEPGSCSRTKGSKLSYSDAGEIFLTNDLLSPLMSGLLFTDFSQKFIPVPIEALDRSRVHELGIERTWDAFVDELKKEKRITKPGPNPLRQRYLAHWNARNHIPALVLNTTDVATGSKAHHCTFFFQKPR